MSCNVPEELRVQLCRELLKPEVFVIGLILRVDGLNIFELRPELYQLAEKHKKNRLVVLKVNKKRGTEHLLPEVVQLFGKCGKDFKNLTIMSLKPGSRTERIHTRIAISPVLPVNCIQELLKLLFGRPVEYRIEAVSININIIAHAKKLPDGRTAYARFDITKYNGSRLIRGNQKRKQHLFQAMLVCGDSLYKASIMFNQVVGVCASTLKMDVGKCTAYDLAEQIKEAIIESGICRICIQ